MKRQLLFLAFLLTQWTHAQDSTRVLFIGNSITYFNDMPQTFKNIANSLGDETSVTMYAPGGTGFVNHVADPAVYNLFRQGNWDYIVLQPGSNESPGYSAPINETLERARTLIDSIYTYNPCADVLFYEISYGVWGNTPNNLATYNNTMSLIKDNLEILADSTKSFFAPVGEGFRTKWNKNQTEMLWNSNGDIHPNAKGSYIAACTFYSTIFQKPSHGSPVISTLSAQNADSIQLLCDSIVLNHLPLWRINLFEQTTDFSYAVTGGTADFMDLSTNVDSVYWDFGDGSFSYEKDPSHNYSETGAFSVVLTTYKHGCEQQISKAIQISSLSVKTFNNVPSWTISPNPARDILYISNGIENGVSYRIYSTSGQLLHTGTEIEIPLFHLDSGVYLIQRTDGKTSDMKRFIKQ